MIANPTDETRLLRIVNEPPRGIGATSLEKIREIAAAENISVFEAMILHYLQQLLRPCNHKIRPALLQQLLPAKGRIAHGNGFRPRTTSALQIEGTVADAQALLRLQAQLGTSRQHRLGMRFALLCIAQGNGRIKIRRQLQAVQPTAQHRRLLGCDHRQLNALCLQLLQCFLHAGDRTDHIIVMRIIIFSVSVAHSFHQLRLTGKRNHCLRQRQTEGRHNLFTLRCKAQHLTAGVLKGGNNQIYGIGNSAVKIKKYSLNLHLHILSALFANLHNVCISIINLLYHVYLPLRTKKALPLAQKCL